MMRKLFMCVVWCSLLRVHQEAVSLWCIDPEVFCVVAGSELTSFITSPCCDRPEKALNPKKPFPNLQILNLFVTARDILTPKPSEQRSQVSRTLRSFYLNLLLFGFKIIKYIYESSNFFSLNDSYRLPTLYDPLQKAHIPSSFMNWWYFFGTK